MALAWGAALQNTVALLLFGQNYSSITANQKLLIDGNSAASPPTAGVARTCFSQVLQVAQWYELMGAATASDQAEDWLIYEIAWAASLDARPERITALRQAADNAQAIYRQTATANDTAGELAAGFDASAFTLTPKALRFHALRYAVRNGVKPFMITAQQVDTAAMYANAWLWQKSAWNFRKRSVTITVPSGTGSTAPTFATGLGANEVFDKIESKWLFFDSDGEICTYITADQYAQFKSADPTGTGKPVYFRLEEQGSTKVWLFYPLPDAAYTLRGEVLIRLPQNGVPASVNDTVPWSLYPAHMVTIVQALTLGRVLHEAGITSALWDKAVADAEGAARYYDDHGSPTEERGMRDVYHDAAMTLGGNGYDVGGQLD